LLKEKYTFLNHLFSSWFMFRKYCACI